MKQAQLDKTVSAILQHVQEKKAAEVVERSRLLPEAISLQDLANRLRALQDEGKSDSKAFKNLLSGFVTRRRSLVAGPVSNHVDALVVVNAMETAANAVSVSADCDCPDTFRLLAHELLLALQNLIPFIEKQAGTTRGQLNLDPNFSPNTFH